MRQKANVLFRGTFSSLKWRNFRLFFIGQFVSQVGNWLTLVAQTLLVFHLTDSGVAVGFLVAFQFAPVLIMGAWAGLVADRVDKRRLLLVIQTLAMIQSFALAAIASMDHPAVWAIYLVAMLGGICNAFDNPARRAFVVEMVPESGVNNAVSLNSALMTGSRMFGPALAGLLAHNFGYVWCFGLDGLSYIAVLVALWMMRPSELRRPPVTPRGKGQIREGFRYARSVPAIWVPLIMMAIIGTLAFNFQVTIPLLTERTYSGNDATFTALFSIVSVGSFIGALAVARRSKVNVINVIEAAIGFGVAMLLLALVPNFRWSLPVGFLVGLASIGFMTACTTIVQVSTAPTMRGRVLALQSMVFLGSTPIGGPIVGWISEQYGPRIGIAVGGISCLIAAAYGRVAIRKSKLAVPVASTP